MDLVKGWYNYATPQTYLLSKNFITSYMINDQGLDFYNLGAENQFLGLALMCRDDGMVLKRMVIMLMAVLVDSEYQ